MNSRLNLPDNTGKTFSEIVDLVMEGLDRDQCLEAAAGFETMAAIIRERIKGGSKNKNHVPIPRGFVMVNMSARDQAELKQLSRECGVTLRNGLRHALLDLRFRLKEWCKIKRQTGLPLEQQDRLLNANTHN